MTAIDKDFEFIKLLSNSFFKQSHIRRTLASIKEDSITGWEKWLQIEFASFLRAQHNITRWVRESSYNLDQRIANSRKKCAVDFIIHEKFKHTHLAVEIKQCKSMKSCLKAMVNDLVKLQKIKKSEFDIRSVWCIGIHDASKIEDVSREAIYFGDKNNIEINLSHVYSNKIGKTGYSFSII